jgi:flagellar hook protein FlgE
VLTFNSDGTLATPATSPSLGVTWSNGAGTSAVTLNFGAANSATGVTQKASGQAIPDIDLTSIQSDGLPYGKLSAIAVGDDGLVNATYSNGETISIYKIPVVTFTAANQLKAESSGLYQATAESGSAVYQGSGVNGAGKIYGSELESSTTDTNEQFSNMISAQQAYSAASQVISTVNKMYDTLMSAMR